MNPRYTPLEDDLLRSLWPRAKRSLIAASFPRRSWASLLMRAQKLCLISGRYWSEQERSVLRELYPHASWKKIMAALPRRASFTRGAITRQANKMKIKRLRPSKVFPAAHPLIHQLAAERRRQGKTQMALGQEMGFSGPQLTGWECEGRNLTFLTFVQWAETLGFEVALRKRETYTKRTVRKEPRAKRAHVVVRYPGVPAVYA